jgi:hypothetical protein
MMKPRREAANSLRNLGLIDGGRETESGSIELRLAAVA